MPMTVPLLTVLMRREDDILLARKRARQIAQFLGFSPVDTTRITTALSEVARNAFEYGGGGTIAFSIEGQALNREELVIRVVDKGVGIADVEAVLSPSFKSRTGMGIGIKGSRSLMDRFVIASTAGCGTSVTMAKTLPFSAAKFGAAEAARLMIELAKASDATPLGELQVQNQALLGTLEELTERQAEVERLSEIAAEARDHAEAAQKVAERSLVVRERFMALTTHELRTPLNAILGYLDLLEEDIGTSISERQANYLTRTKRASKHLLGLTNDFLDMAQGDAGHLRVVRADGAAAHVMAEALALVAPQAAARNIRVQSHAASPNLSYFGDVDRVRQILVNVLGNAVSFTPLGGDVTISAVEAADAPAGSVMGSGPWCVISVADTGPGIPADKVASVFDAFVQLSSAGQASRKGSGLGLTVSRQLALLMGGDLTASSNGVGAVFTLWLPCERRAVLVDDQAEPVAT